MRFTLGRIKTIVTHIAATDDDDVFYLFLQKQKIGAELHISMYLSCRRACLPWAASTESLIFFLSNTQADDYFAALGYQPQKQEFCHRCVVFFQQNRDIIGLACDQAVSLCGAPTTARRHVATPRDLPPLATRSPSTWPAMIMTRMSATSTDLPR